MIVWIGVPDRVIIHFNLPYKSKSEIIKPN